jgi:hypothetical protein
MGDGPELVSMAFIVGFMKTALIWTFANPESPRTMQ